MLILLMAGISTGAIAQVPVVYDSSYIELRTFDQEKLNQYLNDPAYTYDRDKKISRANESYLSRMWRDFQRWMFDNTLANGTFWQGLGYIVAIAAIIFVILGLLKVNVTGLFQRGVKKMEIGYEDADGDINEMDFEALIAQAKKEKRYRRATRLIYLETLKELTHNGLITWKINKTNRDYMEEMRGKPPQKEFADLTLQYEYVWYGDFPIDEKGFASIEKVFKGFHQRLKIYAK